MQHTITFTKDNTKYVSKPFDFEAMCLINDAHNDDGKKGPLSICRGAVDYLFEGTDATQDVIDALDAGERSKMCITLWGFYVDALASKKE
ncbi:MAG: hypothetical protein LUF26_05330 [Firmicutes bacterium]|nr:hypothetical protein [Bacillota bacterium]